MSPDISADGALLSVIVPVFNGEAYLEECLSSIAKQSLTDLEVIIVDDGSTDDSGSIAKSFTLKDERFSLVSTGNGGVSSARNLGLERAEGQYVTFVDADDWLAPQTYQELMKPAQGRDYDAIACDLIVESNTGELTIERSPLPGGEYDADGVRSSILPILISSDRLTRDWPFRIVTKAFRRAHLVEHGLRFSLGLRAAQDFVFSVAAMERTTSFYYAKGTAGYHYRWNPQSRTRSPLSTAWQNYRAVDDALRAAVGDRKEFAEQLVLAELHGDLSAMTYLYRSCSLRESSALYRAMRHYLSAVDRSVAYGILAWAEMPPGKKVVCNLMRARRYRTLHALLMARGFAQALQQRRQIARHSA